MDNTVATLIKLLKINKRADLADLFQSTRSEILESTQYGSAWNSTLSSIAFYSPVEDYLKLRKLGEEDNSYILKQIQEIYPVAESEPEVVAIEYRIDKDEPNQEPRPFIDTSLRLFISYSHHDGWLAGKIKNYLVRYFGIDVFLAHEDIEGGSQWAEELITNLKRTDIFLPLLTSNFALSDFTDQETGAAYVQEKIIVPVSLDGSTPRGFISKIQAVKVKFDLGTQVDSSWLSVCIQIAKAISLNQAFSVSVQNSLIRAFSDSWSYKMTQNFLPILESFEPYQDKQVTQIVSAILNKGQIHGESFKVPQFAKEFMDKHKEQIPEEMASKLTALFSEK